MSYSIRILIVDDNPSDLDLTVANLRRHLISNPIETAMTAEEALSRLRDARKPPVDLLLIDSRLPGKSGEQATREIKADPRLCHIPVVLLATFATMDTGPIALSGEPDATIDKPLRIDLLARKLRKLNKFKMVIVPMEDPPPPQLG